MSRKVETELGILHKASSNTFLFRCPDLGDVSKIPAFVMCSSGTTGLPKGVLMSHSMIIERVAPFW